jgi:hypothetical protein
VQNWFVEPSIDHTGNKENTTFLLKNRDIVDGLYTCCGGNSFDPVNGSMTLPTPDDEALKPFLEAGVRVMHTFGGEGLPLAAWLASTSVKSRILPRD